METHDILLAVAGVLFIVISWSMIAMGFYFKKSLIKQADLKFLGFETTNDSIFFVLLRTTRYATLFALPWHAKRTGETDKAEHFDKKFQRPFKIFFWLMIFGSIFALITMVILNLYHPNYANE